MTQLTWIIIWLAVLIVCAIVEAFTVSLTVIWFAVGALAALICALVGGPLWLEFVLFLAISIICLIVLRPLAKKVFNKNKQATNADRIIGKEAQVTEDIDNIKGTGAVNVSGVIWTARSQTDENISKESLVKIVRIEGVKVFVEKVQSAPDENQEEIS